MGSVMLGLVVAAQVQAGGAWLVDVQDGASPDAVAALEREAGVDLLENSIETAQDGIYLLQDASPAALELLRHSGLVESVEPNAIYGIPEQDQTAADTDVKPVDAPRPGVPNDPMYASQWHMGMIHMEQAWRMSTGKGAVVAVIDTGVSDGKKFPRVPDLDGTSFVPGYNFVADNAQPDDDHGHGTHVAGTIAQATNNAFGVTGVAPGASIMPLKVLSKQGFGTAADIANAIRWAADHGANVINMSLGGGGYTAALAKAVKYAHDKGVVVVCAAGNTGRGRVEYPAAYPGAIAVTSVGPDGQRAWYSSYGKEAFIAAPGGDTRVDLNKDGIADGVLQDTIAEGDPNRHGFFPFQGTSMATPHVAGVAALLVSKGVVRPDAVERILASSASKRDDRAQYGNGVLDAEAALKAVGNAGYERMGAVLGMLLLLGAAASRRLGQERFKPGMAGVAAAVMVGAGLPFLGNTFLASPLAALDAPLWGGPSLLMASVLPSLALAVLLLGVKPLRGVLMGIATGFAAFLLAEPFLAMMDVQGIPGTGVLESAWLLSQGVLSAGLAFLLARR